jgi:hypothetical protein
MTEEITFDSLKLPIPETINKYSNEKKREIYDYLNELTDIEKVGYTIAFNHLESSFDICRSNGFKEWKNSKTSK